MCNARIFLVGENYVERYVSYIGTAMLGKNDTEYHNLQSTMFIDTLIFDHTEQQDLDILPYVEHWNAFLNLNDTFIDTIRFASSAFGMDEYRHTRLAYPGNETASITVPSIESYDGGTRFCDDLTGDIIGALTELNPCFDETHISNYCLFLFSSLSYPTFSIPIFSEPNLSKRAYEGTYINHQDVKIALHAPPLKF